MHRSNHTAEGEGSLILPKQKKGLGEAAHPKLPGKMTAVTE